MLEQIINNYIAEKNTEIRDNTKFRVSDAGRCRLMRFWKRQGKPASDLPDERTRRVFEVGHVFHVWMQEVLRESGVLLVEEFRVEDQHRIGHIDAVIRTKEDTLILYDFKTVHSRKFHYKRKEGDNGDIHYAMQVASYEMLLSFPVHDARIAYISKDDLCIEEVSIHENFTKIRLETISDWDILISAWTSGMEPEANPKSWECKYCIYKSTCKEAIK